MSSSLLGRGKITRTSRGQLPKNYIAGTKDMQRHPFSVGRVGGSPERPPPPKRKKGK